MYYLYLLFAFIWSMFVAFAIYLAYLWVRDKIELIVYKWKMYKIAKKLEQIAETKGTVLKKELNELIGKIKKI